MAAVFKFIKGIKVIPSFFRKNEDSVPEYPAISQQPGYVDGEDNWIPVTDDNFFEAYTSLSWMRENKYFGILRKEEDDKHKPPPDIATSIVNPAISAKEWEDLYVEVLYTIKHKIGAKVTNYTEYTKDLYEYAQEAFGMDKTEHEKFMAVVRDEKPPIPVLNVTVIEAKGLEAKDINGLSDPYCMLGIQPDTGERAESEEKLTFSRKSLKRFAPSIKRKEKKEKEKEHSVNEALPAKFIRTTTVKKATLNPVWKEKIRLDIDDHRAGKLHLDIWDHDDETSVLEAARTLNEVSNLRGLGRYFKDVAQSARPGDSIDDFLGSVNVPLEDVTGAGIDRWYRLRGRSNRSNVQGEIHLKLKFGTREDRGVASGEDNLREIQEHQKLFRIFIDHELSKFKRSSYEWTGEMPQQALLILHQHALQGDITDLQQCVCQWMAIYKKHKEVILDYAFLYQQLQELASAWNKNEEVLSMEEISSLSDSLKEFVEHCLELLRHHRQYFSPHNILSWHRMKFMMKSLAITYNMNAFTELFPFKNDFHVEVTNALKKSNLIWMDEMKLEIESSLDNPNSVQGFIQFIEKINFDLNKAENHHHHVIESILNIDYLPLLFKQTGKQIFNEIVRRIGMQFDTPNQEWLEEGEEIEEPVTFISAENRERVNLYLSNLKETEVFELYLELRDFGHYRRCSREAEPETDAIVLSPIWFIDVMCHWFFNSRHKLRNRILVSLSHDNQMKDPTLLLQELDLGERNKRIDNSVLHPICSTSAMDTVLGFSQLKEFWLTLTWPDESSKFPFVYNLIQALVSGVILYANNNWIQIREDVNTSNKRHIAHISKKAIMILNNIETVLEALLDVESSLDLPAVCMAYGEVEGINRANECKTNIEGSIRDAQWLVDRMRKVVLERFSLKMLPVVQKLIFHVAYAPEKLDPRVSSRPLLEYLAKCFHQMNTHFVAMPYKKMVLLIWDQIISELKNTSSSNIGKEKEVFFQRLHTCLSILFEFFHIDGLFESEQLKTKSYHNLERELKLQGQDTQSLIELLYYKRIQDHKRNQVRRQFGSLMVKAFYNHESESLSVDSKTTLSVDVLHAKHLIPCDPNGSSDPFVVLKLIPMHKFPKFTVFKTKVESRTLDPAFLQRFEWEIPLKDFESNQCLCAVSFVVMDYDYMRKNDFEGEAYLPFDQLKFVDAENPPKPIELNLTIPDSNCSILRALETRKWDTDAKEVLKGERFKRI